MPCWALAWTMPRQPLQRKKRRRRIPALPSCASPSNSASVRWNSASVPWINTSWHSGSRWNTPGDMEKRFAEARVDVAQLRGEMRVLVWQSRLTLGGIVGLVLYALKQAFGL